MVVSGLCKRKDVTRRRSLLRFVVFEFDVQTILNANLHLDRVVAVWWHAERVHPDVFLLHYVCHAPRYRYADEVPSAVVRNTRPRNSQSYKPQLNVDAQVALILLLNVFEHKVERLCLSQFSGGSDFLRERKKFLVVTTVVKQFCNNGRLCAREY